MLAGSCHLCRRDVYGLAHGTSIHSNLYSPKRTTCNPICPLRDDTSIERSHSNLRNHYYMLIIRCMLRLPHHNHIMSPLYSRVSQNSSKHHTASLFPQHLPTVARTSLTTVHPYTPLNSYSYSDSAFSLSEVEIGIY